jgi:hypothetical protein
LVFEEQASGAWQGLQLKTEVTRIDRVSFLMLPNTGII